MKTLVLSPIWRISQNGLKVSQVVVPFVFFSMPIVLKRREEFFTDLGF